VRIAFFVGEFPALSETFVLNQVTGLIDRGHEVDVYAERPRGEPCVHPDVVRYGLESRTAYDEAPSSLWARALLSPIALVASRSLRTLNVRRYGRLAASLRLLYAARPVAHRPTYDVIHAHFAGNGIKAVQLRDAGLLNGAIVASLHGVDITAHPRLYGRRLYKGLFAAGDLFLPISDRWNDLLAAFGCDAQKVLIHRMGVDCRIFPFRSRHPDPGRPARIVTVARLVEKKGIEDGIRAIVRLARSGLNVEYLVAGSGPLLGRLERTVEDLGAHAFVKLLGARRQPEVRELVGGADVFLAPSRTDPSGDVEGIPVSIMEAMACGLPVVSTYHSGIPELVENGVSGFLVKEGDVGGLEERIRRLLENPRARLAMGSKGREIAERDFNIDRLNDRLVEIYTELLARRRRRAGV
jgi:colanic acid/amylovoran biosynthesis glycosyltransferase